MKNYISNILNDTQTLKYLETIIANTDLSGVHYDVTTKLNKTKTDILGLNQKFEFAILNSQVALLPFKRTGTENNLFLDSILFDFKQGENKTLESSIVNMKISKIVDNVLVTYNLSNHQTPVVENNVEVSYSNSHFLLSLGGEDSLIYVDHEIGYLSKDVDNNNKFSELLNLLEPLMDHNEINIVEKVSEAFFEGKKLNEADSELFSIINDVDLKKLNDFDSLFTDIKNFDIDTNILSENKVKMKNKL